MPGSCSVTKSFLTFSNLMDCRTPGLPCHSPSPGVHPISCPLKVMLSNHLIQIVCVCVCVCVCVERERWLLSSHPITQSCLTLFDPMDCSTADLPVPQHLPGIAQVHIHCIGEDVQPSHPLKPSSPSALNLSQDQGLFHRVNCSHQMTKILELQLQHQSFQ